MFDSTKAAVTLLDCVSVANAERLEAMHARCMALSAAKNVNVNATRELAGLIYEILHMPIYHKTIADRLNEQHRRIFRAVSSVETAMSAIDAMDDGGGDRNTAALWRTLSLVRETLTDIAEQIDPPVVLAREEVAHRAGDAKGQAPIAAPFRDSSCPGNG
jgi:DNA-binding GntR family transcriptional regulator